MPRGNGRVERGPWNTGAGAGGARRWWTPLLLAGCLLSAAGCDLFGTREPEAPAGGQSGGDLALTPERVLELLQIAVDLRDPDLYMAMIDVDFRYEATNSAYPEDPHVFDSWDRNREDTFIRRLLAPGLLPADSTGSIGFEEQDETPEADSVFTRQSYLIELHMTRGDLPSSYSGLAELWLVRGDDGGWRIRSWEDDSGGEGVTMSWLRATL